MGGVSLAIPPLSGSSLFAWEGSTLLNKGSAMLNLLSNVLLDSIVPPTGLSDAFKINVGFQYLPSPDFTSTAQAMKWIGF